MKITIKKMLLKNFKGVLGEKEFEFSPTTKVYGKNKSGKTTLADGFRWCLFGKNSEGAANFGIKTKDENGIVIPKLEHEVQITLDVDNREVTLRRVLQEKWSKPVGCKENVLTGHTTIYYVDGNKYTEKDFKEYVAGLCAESLFMCITNPMYFTSLKADNQRALLTKMVGEVNNQTLAKDNASFAALLKEMGSEQLERFMEHIAYSKKEVKNELERIPVRINEQQQGVAELMAAGTDWKQLEGDLQAVNNAMQRIDDEIADRSKVVDSDFERMSAERAAINTLKSEVNKLAYKHEQDYVCESRKLDADKKAAQRKIDDAAAEIVRLGKRKQEAVEFTEAFESKMQDFNARWDSKIADFRARWAEASAEVFTFDDDSDEFICPTCKRRLDDDDVQAAIERMQANFNKQHANKMEALKAEAAQVKVDKAHELEHMQYTLNTYKDDVAGIDDKLHDAQVSKQEAELELDKLNAIVVPTAEQRVSSDEEIAKLQDEITKRTAALNKPADNQPAVDATAGLKADKAQLQQKRDAIVLQLNNKQLIANKQARIAELEKQEKQLNEQLTALEEKEFTAQQLLEANISELEKRVNSLFTMVRFEMFDHKLNGTLKPTCECSVGGVPYSDLNNADRINAGIDIINAICKYNDVYAPCFIDNAESINNVLPMDSQQIQLIVSNDATLTFYPQY